MDHAGGTAADADARSRILRRLDTTVRDRVPVINFVTAPVAVPSTPPTGGWWARWRWRRARRRAERRASHHPEKRRVEFAGWAAIPWRDRPREARLVDVAHDIVTQILACPAWRHPMLDTQRLRLDPQRELADIALSAYELYRIRRQLGPRPGGAAGSEIAARAQAAVDTAGTAPEAVWESLLDRVAALDSYRAHLEGLTPLVAAWRALGDAERLELGGDMAALYTASARHELAGAQTRELTDEVEGIRAGLEASVRMLGADVRALETWEPRSDLPR